MGGKNDLPPAGNKEVTLGDDIKNLSTPIHILIGSEKLNKF